MTWYHFESCLGIGGATPLAQAPSRSHSEYKLLTLPARPRGPSSKIPLPPHAREITKGEVGYLPCQPTRARRNRRPTTKARLVPPCADNPKLPEQPPLQTQSDPSRSSSTDLGGRDVLCDLHNVKRVCVSIAAARLLLGGRLRSFLGPRGLFLAGGHCSCDCCRCRCSCGALALRV